MLRVLCVEDDPLVQSYLGARLSLEPDIEVAGIVASGSSALHYLRQNDVDVVLLDYHLEGVDGIALLQAISVPARHEPAARRPAVIFCTGEANDSFEIEVRALGANGVIPKDQMANELIPALLAVARGDTWFHTEAVVGTARADRAHWKVLIGEDEGPMRALLDALLPQVGCIPTFAWRGEDILRLLEQEAFDLLLLDHQLAGRLLGTQVVDAVAERWPKLPILFMTGLPGEVEKYRHHPSVRGVVPKPFRVQQLQIQIERALDNPSLSGKA